MSKLLNFLVVILMLIFYAFIRYFFPMSGIWGFRWLINPLIYLLIMFLALKLLPLNPMQRDKKAKEKTILILTLLYLMIFIMFGLFLTFERNIYWGNLLYGLRNFYNVVSVIILQEIIRYKLVNNASKNKTACFIIIVLTYFLISFSFRDLGSNFVDFATGAEFVLESIVVPIFKQAMLTYMMFKCGRRAVLIHLIIIEIVYTLTPVFPKMEWFLLCMFQIIWYVIFCLVISYEAISMDRRVRRGILKKENPVVYIFLLSLLILFICFQLGLFAYSPVAIVTNSMVPVFSRGDAVIIKDLDKKAIKELAIDDIIEYKLGNRYVVHRIIDIDKTNEKNWVFTTMGDNNNGPDSEPVEESQISGVVRYRIPYIGYPSVYFIEFFDKSRPDVETGE